MFKIVRNDLFKKPGRFDYFMNCYGAYVSFSCFWFGIGQIIICLISETIYRDVLRNIDHTTNAFLVVVWSVNFYFSHEFADLRFVRKYNAEDRERLEQLEKAIAEFEKDEGFKEWLKKQEKHK